MYTEDFKLQLIMTYPPWKILIENDQDIDRIIEYLMATDGDKVV